MYDFANGDYKAIFEKMPTDPASFRKALKESATVNQKLSKLAISAAEQSAEVSTKWGREILEQINEVNTTNESPAEYCPEDCRSWHSFRRLLGRLHDEIR